MVTKPIEIAPRLKALDPLLHEDLVSWDCQADEIEGRSCDSVITQSNWETLGDLDPNFFSQAYLTFVSNQTESLLRRWEAAPKKAQPVLAEADRLSREGKADEAINLLEIRLTKGLPLQSEIILLEKISQILFFHQRWEKTEDSSSALLRLDPDNPRGSYYLGLALAKLGKEDEALGHFEDAYDRVDQTTDPQLALDITLQLGRMELERGNFKEAERLFCDAVSLDPNSSSAYRELSRVALKRGNNQTFAYIRENPPYSSDDYDKERAYRTYFDYKYYTLDKAEVQRRFEGVNTRSYKEVRAHFKMLVDAGVIPLTKLPYWVHTFFRSHLDFSLDFERNVEEAFVTGLADCSENSEGAVDILTFCGVEAKSLIYQSAPKLSHAVSAYYINGKWGYFDHTKFTSPHFNKHQDLIDHLISSSDYTTCIRIGTYKAGNFTEESCD